MRIVFALSVGAVGLLAACAPEPVPITPNITFNKLGDMQCTPDPRYRVPADPALTHAILDQADGVYYLAPCCPEGYYLPGVPSQGGTLSDLPNDEQLVCVPIPRVPERDHDRDNGDNGEQVRIVGGPNG